MPINFSGLTGEGHLPLDSSFSIAVVYIDILVTSIPPKARQIGGSSIPAGIWGIGQVGLGWFTDDPSGNAYDILALPTFIHALAQTEIIMNSQGGFVYFGSFWWRLTAGAMIDVSISA